MVRDVVPRSRGCGTGGRKPMKISTDELLDIRWTIRRAVNRLDALSENPAMEEISDIAGCLEAASDRLKFMADRIENADIERAIAEEEALRKQLEKEAERG
jgi:hypothetical protein